MLKRITCLFLLVAACSLGAGNLQSRHSSDLEGRNIRRIAALPASVLRGESSSLAPQGGSFESRSERDAAETLARITQSALGALPRWQIVSESEVREVAQSVPAGVEATRMRQIGQMVYADAVMIGRVSRYRERVGDEWGAKSPAAISFVLDLIDVRRGDVIWSARFDETQKSLSENIFAIGDISQRGVRWLSADQLMQEGVKKAVAQLHQIIVRAPAS
jgi:TolB-like protein